jgi:hypothetical protein
VAERQGQLMVEMVQTALREVDLSPEQLGLQGCAGSTGEKVQAVW